MKVVTEAFSPASELATTLTEVISDVVESHSGYLDVSFELPDGGGFRVMDVIVTELPTNGLEQTARVTADLPK